jgi:hypothetical protein
MKNTAKFTETKLKTVKPYAKAQEATVVKNEFSFRLFLWWVFKIVTLPFYMVYTFLFKIPNDGPAPLVGLIRLMVFFSIIYYGQTIFDTNREYVEFVSKHLYLNELFANLLALTVMITIAVGIFSSLLVATGFNSTVGYSYNSNCENSNYNNLKEAFEFRNGILEQETTTGKMKEMAKTGFSTLSNFQNPISDNEKEAFEYLDGQLGMCSTSGKYEKLKQLYSNNK